MKAVLAFLGKYWVHIVVGVVVALTAVYLFRKGRNILNRRKANVNNDQFDPIIAARKLFKAMDGWGTDEAAIWAVLDGATGAQLAAIYNAYRNEYGRDLFDDFADDLSGSEFARAMAYFSTVQLT